MPVLPKIPPYERDILKPPSNEQVRSTYLERWIQGMSSVRLPLDTPSKEDESHGATDLPKRIQVFCQERKEKRKYEWESLKKNLEKMRVRKSTIGSKLKRKEMLHMLKWYIMWRKQGLW